MRYFIIGLGVLAGLILLLNYLIAVAATVGTPFPSQPAYVPADYAPVEQQLLADMGDSKTETATLSRTSSNFYDFAVGPIGGGGGLEVIAYRKTNGHFEVIWQGQDEPNCATIAEADVPANIVPECIWMGARIDRGTIPGFIRYVTISL